MRYYATLGYTPAVLLALQEYAGRRPDVTVFHGDLNPRQARAIARARVILHAMDIRAAYVEVREPWNIEACLRAMFIAFERHGRPADLVINASGGTEVMNAAATLLALLAGCRLHYVDRRAWRKHALDLELVRAAFSLTGTARKILDSILDAGGSLAVSELPDRLGVTAGAVSQVLKRLVGTGVVELRPKSRGRGKLVVVSDAAWIMVLFKRPATLLTHLGGEAVPKP